MRERRKGEGKNSGVFSRIFAGEELSRCVLCGFFFFFCSCFSLYFHIHAFALLFKLSFTIWMWLLCHFLIFCDFSWGYNIYGFICFMLPCIFFFCHTCYFKLVSSLLGCEARNGKCWVAFTKNELLIPLLLLLVRVGYVHGWAVLRGKKKLRGRPLHFCGN